MMTTSTATFKEMMDYETLLVSKKGDQIWRYSDGFDGKPRFKIFAVEPRMRTQIKKYQGAAPGADYFIGGKYYATDYIVPKKYLKRIAKLLGFDLRKNPARKQSEKQKAAFAKFSAGRQDRSQTAMEFAQPSKVA